ncbi:MAG: Hsp20/alpha crystallin family protein [Deltaproteobacteria bacterium]|nr:Hsp20/alpha crystallin family protein [Deltaproteobacteria bacterium]
MSRDPMIPSLRHEVDRLFDSLIHVAWGTGPGERCWMPSADVVEDAEGYRLEMDLPGVRFSGISIAATGRILRIEGRRERVQRTGAERPHLLERPCGRFVRTFQLPGDADPAGIHASLSEGVLTVEIPRLHRGRMG